MIDICSSLASQHIKTQFCICSGSYLPLHYMMNTLALPYLTDSAIQHFITEALREDIGSGDVSALSSVPEAKRSSAELKIKDNGILAGMELARKIFMTFDPDLSFEPILQDEIGRAHV